MNSIEMDVDTRCTVMQYLRLISRRASGEITNGEPLSNWGSIKLTHTPSGELMTTARWIRSYLTSHPLYKQDSVVTEEMTYDLMKRMLEVTDGTSPSPDLTGKLISKAPDN